MHRISDVGCSFLQIWSLLYQKSLKDFLPITSLKTHIQPFFGSRKSSGRVLELVSNVMGNPFGKSSFVVCDPGRCNLWCTRLAPGALESLETLELEFPHLLSGSSRLQCEVLTSRTLC